MKAFIHPTRAIVETPEQIYAERNKLLRDVERLERRLQTANHLRKNTLRKLKELGKLTLSN